MNPNFSVEKTQLKNALENLIVSWIANNKIF
mgnify:CR=1 FL=1